MRLPRAMMPALARQLGRPSGVFGRYVARNLDRGNRATISAAVEALEVTDNDTVADIGFGGGVGLDLLLGATQPNGHVHGVELAPTMLSRATRRYRVALNAGRLSLHQASMTALPLDTGTVNGAITINTVYFIEDLDAAFTELARVLAPHGRLVIGVGDPAMMADLPFTRYGFRLRPVADVASTAERSGLKVDHRRLSDDERAYHLLVCQPAE